MLPIEYDRALRVWQDPTKGENKMKLNMQEDFEGGNIPVGKIIGFVALFLVVVMALGWLVQGNDFFMYKFWAPKQEAVHRQVFEQTPSFNKGMIQELENMQVEYIRTKDPEAKATLAGVILHRASGYNLNDPDVSADLRSFLQKLKDEQNNAR